jgi:hypothetical protein
MPIIVRVRSLKGQTWTLEADERATVLSLKQQLAEREPSLAACKLFLAVRTAARLTATSHRLLGVPSAEASCPRRASRCATSWCATSSCARARSW